VDAHSNLSIRRWTNLSLGVAIVVAVLFVSLSVGPAFLPANILDKLTVLFIYVCLAAMWNALAGYGGMISAGQQAFFGLGGYLAIRLSEWGIWPYPALIAAGLLAGVSALPISAIVLRLRAGEFAIGMWIIAECIRLLVNLDPIIQGDTGRSLIALSAFDATERRIFTYWLALASMGIMLGVIFLLLRSRLGSSIQAIRDNEEAAASVGVRVLTAKRIIFVIAAVGCALAGALWLATFTTFQPRSFFGIQWSAYMIFMVLVGGIGRFEGPILGAIIFFLIEIWLGSAGVWYLIVLGFSALLFSLFLPKGIWGYVEDRFHVLLLPVGYRLRMPSGNPAATGPGEALQ
jgi:branched-chain amino acid transport system permease protein